MNYQMRLIDLMQLVDSDTVSTTVVSGLSLDSRRLKSGDLCLSYRSGNPRPTY